MEAGQRLVRIELDNQSIEFNLDIRSNTKIQDPKGYLDNWILRNESYIATISAARLEQQLDSSTVDFDKIEQDASIWSKVNADSKDDILSMNDDQQRQLANVLEANGEWIANMDNYILGEYIKNKRSKSECKALVNEGKEELKNGNVFSAFGTSIESYWCAVSLKNLSDAEEDSEKALMLFEETDDIWALNTLTNFIGRKVDELTKEVSDLGQKEYIATDIEEAEKYKKGSKISFGNGDPTALRVKMKFANIHSFTTGDDINTITDFKEKTATFSRIYEELLTVSKLPFVWKPTSLANSKTRLNNRLLSVDTSSISNKDIVLVNTQYNNDEWEVVFGNDGAELEPEFYFDIVYNDGVVELRERVSGKIKKACANKATYSLVTDTRDGNKYKTVVIGDQTWFAENLRYEGASHSPYPIWPTSPKKEIYGLLYNGNDVYERAEDNVCPAGWHVPSDGEWNQLEKHIGVTQKEIDDMEAARGEEINAGELLKDCDLWNGTNNFGLTLLPTGYSYREVTDISREESEGYYWTSTKTWGKSDVYPTRIYRRIVSGFRYIERGEHMHSYYSAVRCVKD